MVCVRRASLDVHFSFRHLTLIRASFFSLAPVGRTFFSAVHKFSFTYAKKRTAKKLQIPFYVYRFMKIQFKICIYSACRFTLFGLGFDGITVCEANRRAKAQRKWFSFVCKERHVNPLKMSKMANQSPFIDTCLLKFNMKKTMHRHTSMQRRYMLMFILYTGNRAKNANSMGSWESINMFTEAHSTHQSIGWSNLWKTSNAQIQNRDVFAWNGSYNVEELNWIA